MIVKQIDTLFLDKLIYPKDKICYEKRYLREMFIWENVDFAHKLLHGLPRNIAMINDIFVKLFTECINFGGSLFYYAINANHLEKSKTEPIDPNGELAQSFKNDSDYDYDKLSNNGKIFDSKVVISLLDEKRVKYIKHPSLLFDFQRFGNEFKMLPFIDKLLLYLVRYLMQPEMLIFLCIKYIMYIKPILESKLVDLNVSQKDQCNIIGTIKEVDMLESINFWFDDSRMFPIGLKIMLMQY